MSPIRNAILAFGMLALLAPAAHAQRSQPFTSAVLRVQVQSRAYESRLHGDLAILRRSLEDSLHLVFATRFPFVRWRVPRARDTVFVFLRDGDDRNLYMDITVGASRHARQIFRAPLETRAESVSRRDWRTSKIIGDWLEHINAILERDAQSVVAVVGQMPLPTSVDLHTSRLRAVVAVGPQRLQASRRLPPKFRVRATLEEPGPPRATHGPAELVLAGCVNTARDEYACDIEALIYKDRTEPAEDQRALLVRATLRDRTVHLLEYSSHGNVGPVVLTASGANR